MCADRTLVYHRFYQCWRLCSANAALITYLPACSACRCTCNLLCKQMLSQADTKAVLKSDGGYFFALLDRFASDMEAQPAANPHRDILLEQLKNIKELANAAVA